MWIALHACALLACPIVAITAVFCAPRKTGQKPAGLWALAWPALLAFLPATTRHMCDEGQAFLQWLVPLLCLWLVAVGVGHAGVRRCVALLLAVAMWRLTWHFDDAVHGNEVTGNPNWDSIYRASKKSYRDTLAGELSNRAAADATEYPAGWVRDLPFATYVKSSLDWKPIRGETADLWHTRWTCFYRRIVIPQDYWYPGGTLAAAAEHIEIRDRPDATWGREQ